MIIPFEKVTSGEFAVIGITANYCRFSPNFLERLEQVSQIDQYEKIVFYQADIEQHQHLVEYGIKGTPAILILSEPYIKDCYTGNFNYLQICSLINLSLSSLSKKFNELTNDEQ
ncbi:MAG: hypothetical protein SVR94_00425 [Pseudomonadota bacterium]|nr:hypothetical protein [Pseudomonadota bacterium]